MDGKSSISLLFLLLSLMSLLGKCYSSSEDDLKTYIVYTGNSRNDETSSLHHYKNLLQQVAADSSQEPKPVLQHYKRSFSGFVANLTEEEANKMAGLDGVVSVFPNEKRHLLTTKSWDFVGLTQYVESLPSESDVIIGVFDTGIWPESISFNDKGFSSPPTKWKGTCDTSNFPCNNKIIGAKHYLSTLDYPLNKNEIESPRDSDGHGTHTASTAAGNQVRMASMLGLAQGTARGGAPSARIAVYKICWSRSGCSSSNILAAFDDAIADGVDIISFSIGGGDSKDMICCKDAMSIGSFHAMQRGVLTVMSAGNEGPRPSSLLNFSPWAIVVGASTLDRKFVTKVKLGDNRVYEGVSLNTFDLEEKQYPLIYGGDAPNTKANITRNQSRFCSTNSLNDELVKGKIIICQGSVGVAKEAFRVGAAGVLNIQDDIITDIARSYPLPACSLHSKDFNNILKYIYSARSATIFRTNELNDTLAPVVASFSSRGPSKVIPEILKPDLTAPGVNIIASWPTIAPISDIPGEKRKLEFNIISGTSMSCPHVSGAAAYIKSFNPTWSPAALRSALMTTAKHMSSKSNGDAEFGYGAGQINPVKALNPGLIYDAQVDDYIRFLCGQGISTKTLQRITKDDNTCSNKKYGSARDLNYPSFALKVPQLEQLSGSFSRTVTNVGLPNSTYRAIVTAPKGLNIKVTPNILSFTSIGEMKSYTLTIEGAMKKAIASASLVWEGGNFQVRSPIIVYYYEEADNSASSPTSYVRVYAVLVGIAAIFLIYISIVIITKYRKRDKIP